MSKIPSYILCKNPEEARQVLEKIERESDLRWTFTLKKPVDGFNLSTRLGENPNYPLVIRSGGELIYWTNKKHYEDEGITNFTKAEDYLKEETESFKITGTTLMQLDNQLDKLIDSDMTNKTWDNLAVGWLLEYDGDEFQILSIHDRVIDLSVGNNFDEVGGNFTKEELIADGYKIKGASEENPSIDDVIKKLTNSLNFVSSDTGCEEINEAIEMIKKLK